jgi:O-antigen/teichoic acid export membrane protein
LENKISEIFFDKKFTADTFWLISSQGILIISGFLVNLIIGYQYDAATLGVFNQILGFYLILSTFFSLGLNNCLIQKISYSSQELYPRIFSSNIVLTSISTLVFSGLLLVLTAFVPTVFSSAELAQGLFIATLSLPLFNWNKNFMAFSTGIRDQRLFSNIRSLRWLLLIAVIGIVSLIKADEELLFYSFLIAEGIIFVFLLFRFSKFFTTDFGISDLKSNLAFGLKSFIAEIFSVMNDKLDLIILGYLLTNTEVGVYSFFIFFAKSLYIFPGIPQQNINPLIGKHWATNTMKELDSTLNKIRKVNAAIVMVQALAIVLFYKVLTDYYKPEFADSLKYLALTLIGIIPFALIGWGGSILVMTGKLKANIYRTLILLVFTILSSVALTYHLGMQGASLAVVSSGLFGFLLMFGFVKRETGIRLI